MAWRALACLLLALGLLLAAAPLAAQTPAERAEQLRRGLMTAEDLRFQVQAEQRLRLLQQLQPAPGSEDELVQLYLIATTPGGKELDEARWSAWQRNADVAMRPLGDFVRALARAERAVQVQHYREAMELLPATRGLELPPSWRLRERLVRADAVEEGGDPQAALLLRLEADQMLESVATPARQAEALMFLSVTYGRVGQADKGLVVAEEALQRAGPGATAPLRAQLYNGLALAYNRLNRDDDSRAALEKALQYAEKGGDAGQRATLLGNISDAYLRARQWQKALKAAEDAYALALAQKDRAGGSQALALHNRGIAKIRLGRVQEGKADVRQSVTLELQRGGQTYAADGLVELGAALEVAGDLPGALQAYHEYRELADAQTRIDRRDALREAQSKADAARRKRETQRLTEENAAAAAAAQQQRLRLFQGLLAIACGLALLVFIVLLYRRLRQTNALLALTNRDLAAKSETDPLTGLGNRRRIERLLRRHERDDGLHGAVLLIDIDHFKQINDQHGHAAGDLVLQAVAGRLRAALRESESEGVVRWGGEEFLLLLPGADSALVAALAQRLLVDLAGTPVALRDGMELRVTASIGAAAFPEAAPLARCNGERAIAVVDSLMYRAKLRGRQQAWQLMGSEADSAEALLSQLNDADAAEAAGSLRLRRHGGRQEATA